MKERLKKVIDYYGYNQTSFAKKCNISEGTIRKVLTDGTTIRSDNLVKISQNFTNINLDWLLLGRGEMLLENDKNSLVPEKIYQEIRTENERLIRQNERLLVEVEQLKKQAAQKEPAAECATA